MLRTMILNLFGVQDQGGFGYWQLWIVLLVVLGLIYLMHMPLKIWFYENTNNPKKAKILLYASMVVWGLALFLTDLIAFDTIALTIFPIIFAVIFDIFEIILSVTVFHSK